MKQYSFFKRLWKINIPNVGSVMVGIYQAVCENSNHSPLICLHLRLGAKWGKAPEFQHRERNAKRDLLLVHLDERTFIDRPSS